MPRLTLPPTPGSSSDIKGKDGIQQLTSLQLAFELPPPALHDAHASQHNSKAAHHAKLMPPSPSSSSSSPSSSGLSTVPGTNYPMQAAEAVKSRRRSTVTSKESKDGAFSLPPPPTRSRKIIQMKPRTQEVLDHLASAKAGASGSKVAKDAAKTSSGGAAAASAAAAAAAASSSSASANAGVNSQGGKKKQPSATSAAGRKIARKTAHSLIERRRRSKMNEEFALLKSMIPACTGEMHKLAILQASIEYVRYLEDCVAKLKAQEAESQQERSQVTPLPSIRDFHPSVQGDMTADAEMTDSEAPSPDLAPDIPPPSSTIIYAQEHNHRQSSYSPASTDQRHYSYSNSTTTSPAFGPQQHVPGFFQGYISASNSTLTSPALLPQSDLDQEATAALLMLNSDRSRSTIAAAAAAAKGNGRGLSVRDLLSS